MKKAILTLFCLISVSVFSEQAYIKPKTQQKPAPAQHNHLDLKGALTTLDTTIQANEISLENLKWLKKTLPIYQNLSSRYIQNPENKRLLFELVRVAKQMDEVILDNHLETLFSQEFLKELSLFAKIGKKA